MNLLTDLRRRFDYHFWAAGELLDTLTDEDILEKAKAYLAHAFAGISPPATDYIKWLRAGN